MERANPLRATPKNPSLAGLFSLIVPGAGQFYLGDSLRGAAVLTTTLALAYLINWALDNFKVGLVNLGVVATSWLWLLLALFWLWNIFDAYRHAQGQIAFSAFGFLLPALIIYTLAWQVTDVRLNRLVTGFGDLRTIGEALIHPDLFTTDESGAIHPSENFGDIIGRVSQEPAPALLVNAGLLQAGATILKPIAGTLFVTIAQGLLATLLSIVLAIPLSFFAAHNIMSRVPGGAIIYYLARAFFNIMRSIDTLIWGLIVIVWVGQGPFAGMLALAIHSIAALAKLYSEEIEHIDPGPIEAITATGANLLQVIRYAVIPQIVPPFLAYSLLRWDINMRSATVIGFVGGGGIGFFVVETIHKGGYEQYAAALWMVAIVIIIVDYVSARWREQILVGETKPKTAPASPLVANTRKLFYAVLLLAVFVYSWQLTEIDLRQLLDPGPTFLRLVRDFIAFDISPDILDTVWRQMLLTIFQALLATTLGGLIALPFSFLAARNLTGRSRLSIWIYYAARGLLNVLRSIEALLYVAIFVFWVGIGAFAGTLALAVTTFALIAKLFSEAIENIDPGPVEAITATGATRVQSIIYGILPQIVPPFVSYSIYQWDINIRIATIIGFAGGGGIGLLFQVYSGQLQYHKAGTVVALIVLVVVLMDFASAKIREKLV